MLKIFQELLLLFGTSKIMLQKFLAKKILKIFRPERNKLLRLYAIN